MGSILLIVSGFAAILALDLKDVGAILVGVGGILLFVGWVVTFGATGTNESALRMQTDSWTRAVLVRSYPNGAEGLKSAEREANVLASHGYEVAGQSGSGSHVNIGRTAAGAVLTGGISLLFGGSRAAGTVQITFVKRR